MTSIGTTAGSPFAAKVGAGHSCHCRPMSVKPLQSTCALVVRAVPVVMFSFDIGLPFVVSPRSITVSTIVRRALIRAGVDSVRKGAHLFRHTLATDLLREGASLDEIGELLRHRSPNTTAVYAKVDLAALRTLALPWPGGVAMKTLRAGHSKTISRYGVAWDSN